MMQSFLWMQLSKEKDNPGLNQQSLAKFVAQSFNRRAYIGQRTIQWERFWMSVCSVLIKLYGPFETEQSPFGPGDGAIWGPFSDILTTHVTH